MGVPGRSSREPMLVEFAVGAWAAEAGHFDRSGRGFDGRVASKLPALNWAIFGRTSLF